MEGALEDSAGTPRSSTVSGMAKEAGLYGKSDLPVAKESYGYGKTDLWIWQKRPMDMAKVTYLWQKRPIDMAKVTYMWHKRLIGGGFSRTVLGSLDVLYRRMYRMCSLTIECVLLL